MNEGKPYTPFEGDFEQNPQMKEALVDYENSLKQLAEGTFPVKKGSHVFRVINGYFIGSNTPILHPGDKIANNYATPHANAVEIMFGLNDREQSYYDGSPFDNYQRVAVVEVDEFSIPKPDITHIGGADKDQVMVTGEVKEVLTPNEFIGKYLNTDKELSN
jgi:hypothetical protein